MNEERYLSKGPKIESNGAWVIQPDPTPLVPVPKHDPCHAAAPVKVAMLFDFFG